MDTSRSCSSCGHANRGNARFCEACGATLETLCPACGQELRSNAQFCDACGTPVAQPGGAEARKTVTIIFSDLVGSTALQEALDAESVRRVMGRFYAAMQAAIEGHGGRVEKFIGDAVMGVFGVPAVREDDAIRAARAAIDMVAALDELNDDLERDWGVRLGMRTGVNTGEVVVASTGFLVGDPVNVAARLEQAARPGEVLIGETTARLIRHDVALEPAPALEAKGKSAALVVHALVTSGQPAAVAARLEVPLVGRGAELSRLQELFDDAVAQRTCRLATVIGSPGLGKTRLARELADGLAGGAIVVEGHCEPQGQGITFLPVADVLRDAAGIGEADAADDVRAKLGVILEDDPDRERIVERDAGVLGIVPPASAEETFWAVRRTLESLARRRPLLVLLDDIHWGQPQFLDLIEHLVQWSVDAPMLILALARPELRERHDSLTRQGTIASAVIDLEPLHDDHSRELMTSLLEGAELPTALAARVLYTTGGNPLFLGETIRMLADDGVLRRGEDGTIDVDLGGVDVPPTITALLAARIERLGADERSVVERAAVIGKQFYRGAVAVMSAPPVASHVDAHLEALRLKEMVEPDGTYWIDEPVYRFHHVLIRDAAYRALLKEARAELHERFAQWLEEKAGELVGEHEEVIAFHLEQAHEYRRELGPLDDRGRALGAQAATRLRSAGRRALDRDDLAAAANLLGRALDRIETSETAGRAEVLLDLAEALIAKGDTVAAAEVVEQLRVLAGSDARFVARADVLAGQLDILMGVGGVPATIASVRAAVDVLAADGDGVGEAKGHHVVAQAEALLGQVAAVEEALDRALAAARRAEDRRRVTAVLAAAPRAALWGPSPVVRASGRCLDVVRILRMTPGNRHVEAIALRCQAVLEAMRGRTDAAREILDAGRATLEELGLTLELHETAIYAGMVELLAGDPAAAEQHLRVAADGFAALGIDLGRAQASALLARALVEQGRHDEAIAASEDAEEHGGGDLKTTITWCGVRAEALARAGDVEAALALAQRAVNLAEPTDALPDKADASMALARVLGAAGREADARAAAAHARQLYAAKEHSAGVLRATALAGGERATTRPGADPGDAEIADPELRRFFAHYQDCYAARDVDGVIALFHPEYVMVDHRRLGWGEVHGLEDLGHAVRTMIGSADDLRPHVEEVHAAGDGVIAMRLAWRGTSSETGGRAVVPVGYVGVVRDGRLWRTDLYEPEDTPAMLARVAELTRPREFLGDPELARFFAHYQARYAAGDVDGIRALYDPDCVIVDHRQIGWEELHGSGDVEQLLRTMMRTASDLRMDLEELHAAQDGVSAMSVTWRGTSNETGGPVVVPIGYVAVTRDGLLRRIELYEPEDKEAMLARFAELTGGASSVLAAGALERAYAEWAHRFNARDFDGLLALLTPEWVMVDRRAIGWPEQRGRAQARAMYESLVAISPDIAIEIDDVLACDERVIALRFTLRGHAADGSGEFVFAAGHVTLAAEDGLCVSTDQFEHDDVEAMLARFAELTGGDEAVLGDKPPERRYAEWCRRFRAHDTDELLELYAEDWTMVDHRTLAWPEQHNLDEGRSVVESAFAASPDLDVEVDEVLACDERVIALRVTFLGHASVGSGELAYSVGQVTVVENGRAVSTDQYEPDDVQAMLARFVELGGGLGPLGDRAPERLAAEFARRYAARDVEGLLEFITEESVLRDHRRLPWEQVSGRDAFGRLLAGTFETYAYGWDATDEVLACDDRVIALRHTWHQAMRDGGGRADIATGIVTVWESGRVVSSDLYDPDDRAAMLARYRELGGRAPVLGDKPPERFWAEFERRHRAGDLAGLLDLYAEDWVLVDHSVVGWGEFHGKAGAEQLLRSAEDVTDDLRFSIDEVLACDARVVAAVASWRGRAKVGGGDFLLEQLSVAVIEEGRWVSCDLYNPEDRQAAIARYAELGGPLPALGDKPPERFRAEYKRRFDAHDLEGIGELFDEDHVLIDHRKLAWEEVRGRAAVTEMLRAPFGDVSDVRIEHDEVLACDDRVIAVRGAWRGSMPQGGGPMEIPFGMVTVIEDGRQVCAHVYEPEDSAAMVACYAELGGGLAPLGDRPPERHAAALARGFAARDADAVGELFSEGWVFADHRNMPWDPARGREGAVSLVRSAWLVTDHMRLEVDDVLACDDRVVAMRCTWRGTGKDGSGEMAVSLGVVSVVEHGLRLSDDYYDYDDREAMLARYAELGGRGQVLGDKPPERFMAEYERRVDAGDLDGLVQLHSESWVLVDHSVVGWGEFRGREGADQLLRSSGEVADDLCFRVDEVLACDDRVIVAVASWRGRMQDGGGDFAGVQLVVAAVEDGCLATLDIYNPGDRQAAIARYAELGGGTALLGRRPPELCWKQWARAYAARDAAAADLHSEDWTSTDHRRIGWDPAHGRDRVVERLRSQWDATDHLRLEVDEVLACDERVLAMRVSAWGAAADGGGELVIPLGVVSVVEDGARVSDDFYEHDDREAMLARYRDLSGERPGVLGDRPPERVVAELVRLCAAGDVDAIIDTFAPDHVLVDHRPMGWDSAEGRDAMAEVVRSFATTPGLRYRVDEVLACDERTIAFRATWIGSNPYGGGDWALPLGYVLEVESDQVLRHDVYEHEDSAAMIARYAELGGGQGPLGDRPPESFWKEWIRRFAARDLGGGERLLDEGCTLTDHRALGWGRLAGREAVTDFVRSAMQASPALLFEVDDVIACEDRVVAIRGTWRGPGEKAGEFALPVANVAVIEDGRCMSMDIYESDATDAALTRYAELAGGLPVLGDKPPERFWAQFDRRLRAGDLEALMDLYAEDWVLADHSVVGWGEFAGREGGAQLLRSAWDVADDLHFRIEEVLACDDRVIAGVSSWRGRAKAGGGDFVLMQLSVAVIEDGRWQRCDVYNVEDRQAAIARYAELGGGQGPLGDRPPEVFWKRWARLYAARDEAIAQLHSEDYVFADHRVLPWDAADGRDGAMALIRSGWDVTDHVRLEVDEVVACDGRVVAMRGAWCGAGTGGSGAMALPVGMVNVVENGRTVRGEFFDADDTAGMLARFAELTPAATGRPPERCAREYARRFATGDVDAVLDLYAEDHVVVDHRKLAWEQVRKEDMRKQLESLYASAEEVRFDVDGVVACDDHVMGMQLAFRGTSADGGGPFEIAYGAVAVVEGGRVSSVDQYDYDDKAAMIARYAELGGGQAALGDRPPESFWKVWIRLFAARDLDGLAQLTSEAATLTDHRPLGWERLDGRDAFVRFVRSTMEASSGLLVEADEVLACDERVIALRGTWRGQGRLAGELALPVANVTVVEDGRFVSMDVYEADETDAALARFEELRAASPAH